MRLRPTLASLVAVLLLSIPCMANACGTSCDLSALGICCHHASNESGAPAMAGMHDCGMDMSRQSVQVHADDNCKHFVCEQQPQTVANDQAVLHARSLATVQAVLTVLVFHVSTLNVRIEPASSAPLRVPLLITLQMTLRV